MLKIENGIFWTSEPGEASPRRSRPAITVVNITSITNVPMFAGRKLFMATADRVGGEHEPEGDAHARERRAQDRQPGERGESRLGALQHDAGDHRPCRDLPDLSNSSRIQSLTGTPSRSRTKMRATMPTTQIATPVNLATRASLSASPASHVFIGRNYPGEQPDRMSAMLDGQEWRTGSRRRAAAGIALVLGAATLLLALYVFVQQFPRGLAVLGCAAVALAAGWYGILRRGPSASPRSEWRWSRSPYRSCSC